MPMHESQRRWQIKVTASHKVNLQPEVSEVKAFRNVMIRHYSPSYGTHQQSQHPTVLDLEPARHPCSAFNQSVNQ